MHQNLDNTGFSPTTDSMEPSQAISGDSPRPIGIAPRSRSSFVPAAIIAMVALAIYGNALFNGFAYDDFQQIVDNPWLREFRWLPQIFGATVWQFDPLFDGSRVDYYRPLMHVANLLVYHMVGLRPWGYHLVNVLLHAADSVMVFVVVSRLAGIFRSSTGESGARDFLSIPFLTALLFALHPIHVEAVAWNACFPEVSFTLFFLLSFDLYIRSENRLNRNYLLSLLLFFAAVVSKETALVLPIILAAYDFCSRKQGEPWVPFRRYIPFALAICLYFFIRYLVLGDMGLRSQLAPSDATNGLFTFFQLFAEYVKKLLLPLDLSAVYVFPPLRSLLELQGLAGIAASVVFVAGTALSLRKDKLVFLALIIFIAPLLPVLYMPSLGEYAFAERYAYVPSVGFALLTAILIDTVRRREQMGVAVVIVCLVTVFYAVGTVRRNLVWHDSISLFTDVVRQFPNDPKGYEILAGSYIREGRMDEGIREMRTAISLNPRIPDRMIAEGVTYIDKGLPLKAVSELEVVLMLQPDSPDAHFNLGLACDELGMDDKAIGHYRDTLRLKPDHAHAHNGLGVALIRTGNLPEGIRHLEEAVRLNQGVEEFRLNLEDAYEVRSGTKTVQQQAPPILHSNHP